MRLTKRVVPYSYESIYSFTVRETKENYLSPLQLWNCCKAARLLTLSDTYTLIFCPENLVDIKKLADLTGLTESRLFEMTFYNLLIKFKGDNASRARLMSGLLRKEYYYCPCCLQERPHHSLLWSLKDIHICGKHHSELLDICIYCGKAIHLIEVVDFSRCPHCGGDLRHISFVEPVNNHEQEWRLKNYEFLLAYNNAYVDRIDIAIKLQFILNKYKPVFDRQVVCDSLNEEVSKLPTLLQHARNTLSQKRVLELQFILNILYKAGISIEQFFNIIVPKEFRISITQKKQAIKDSLSCIAPWCRHYGVSGSLLKTGTSFKKMKDGSLKYYLLCKSCGCQYALDSDNNLIERTNFIRLHNFFITVKCQTISLKALSGVSKFPVDNLIRALAYFDSRRVFCFEPYHVESDQMKVSAFIQAIHSGEKIKNIQFWKTWCNYYEYLFYRYHQEVLRAETEDKRMNLKYSSANGSRMLSERIEPVLEALLHNGEDITIRKVCERVHICHATLENWGGLTLVSSYKEKQKQLKFDKTMSEINAAFEAYLDNHYGVEISSKEIYNHLGIIRSVLWRTAPEMTSYIHEEIKRHNQLFSN